MKHFPPVTCTLLGLKLILQIKPKQIVFLDHTLTHIFTQLSALELNLRFLTTTKHHKYIGDCASYSLIDKLSTTKWH